MRTIVRHELAPPTIKGRKYTGHALDQMQGWGLTPSVVEDTIQRGASLAGKGITIDFVTEQVKVVVNGAGDVVTVWPKTWNK